MRASWLFTYLCFYGGTTRFKSPLEATEKPVSEQHVEQWGSEGIWNNRER